MIQGSNATTLNAAGGVQQAQVIQLHPTQMVNTMAPPPGGIQIVQQIVDASGQIQQIPIQLTNQQLQLIRAQMTSNKAVIDSFECSVQETLLFAGTQQQPLVIQTAPIQAATIPPNQIQQNQIQLPQGQQVYIQQPQEG